MKSQKWIFGTAVPALWVPPGHLYTVTWLNRWLEKLSWLLPDRTEPHRSGSDPANRPSSISFIIASVANITVSLYCKTRQHGSNPQKLYWSNHFKKESINQMNGVKFQHTTMALRDNRLRIGHSNPRMKINLTDVKMSSAFTTWRTNHIKGMFIHLRNIKTEMTKVPLPRLVWWEWPAFHHQLLFCGKNNNEYNDDIHQKTEQAIYLLVFYMTCKVTSKDLTDFLSPKQIHRWENIF